MITDHDAFDLAISRAKNMVAERFQISQDDVTLTLYRIDEANETVHLVLKVKVEQYNSKSIKSHMAGLATALREIFQRQKVNYFPAYTPIFEEVSGVRA